MLENMSRLFQTVKPIRLRLILGLLSAIAASTSSLMIPQTLEWIINRLDASPPTAAVVWTGCAIVMGIGLLERR